MRWVLKLQEYDYKIEFLTGMENGSANALSQKLDMVCVTSQLIDLTATISNLTLRGKQATALAKEFCETCSGSNVQNNTHTSLLQ